MLFNLEPRTADRPEPAIRHDWTEHEVLSLLEMPFSDLIYQAQTVHRAHFDPNEVQISTLLSIKTGGCPEDCAYCPQSAHYKTGLAAQPLLTTEVVLAEARKARESGATRFCMGAACARPGTAKSTKWRRWWPA